MRSYSAAITADVKRFSNTSRQPCRDSFPTSATALTRSSIPDAIKPVTPGLSTSGTEPQRLDHRESEWLGPVHREEQRYRAAKEILLLGVVYFTEKFDPRGGEQRLDYRIKGVAVDPIDLGRNLEWNPGAPRDFDRKVRPLLGRDTAEEGEVGAGAGVEAQKIRRQAVINRSDPVHERERAALLVTDRDQPQVGVRPVERHEGLEIEPAVHG